MAAASPQQVIQNLSNDFKNGLEQGYNFFAQSGDVGMVINPLLSQGAQALKAGEEEIKRPAREAKEETKKQQDALNQQITELDKRKKDETEQAANAARSAAIRSRRYDLPSPTTFTSSLGTPSSGGKKLLGI